MTGRQWMKMGIVGDRISRESQSDHFRGFESYWEIPAGSDTAPGK